MPIPIIVLASLLGALIYAAVGGLVFATGLRAFCPKYHACLVGGKANIGKRYSDRDRYNSTDFAEMKALGFFVVLLWPAAVAIAAVALAVTAVLYAPSRVARWTALYAAKTQEVEA